LVGNPIIFTITKRVFIPPLNTSDELSKCGEVEVNQSKNQYATKKDLESTRHEVLDKIEATKQELINKLVSKEELKEIVATLATKEELRREVAKLATKEELEKVKQNLEIVANQVAINTLDIKEIKVELVHLKGDMGAKFEMVLEAIDGVMAELKDQKVERAATDHSLRRHETKLDNHETRIHALENKSAP